MGLVKIICIVLKLPVLFCTANRTMKEMEISQYGYGIMAAEPFNGYLR